MLGTQPFSVPRTSAWRSMAPRGTMGRPRSASHSATTQAASAARPEAIHHGGMAAAAKRIAGKAAPQRDEISRSRHQSGQPVTAERRRRRCPPPDSSASARSVRARSGAGARLGGRAGRAGARAVAAVALPLDLPPAGDVAVVLLQRAGEGVAAGAVGDEVEVVRLRRPRRRAQRLPPGRGDGRRRQAAVAVGVEGRVAVEVGAGQRPVQPGAVRRGVGDRGVGLQRHPAPEAVDVDGGDARPLLRQARFLLHDGGEHQRLARRRRAAGRARARATPPPAPPASRPRRGGRWARGPRRTGRRRCRAAARPRTSPASRRSARPPPRTGRRSAARSGPPGWSGAAAPAGRGGGCRAPRAGWRRRERRTRRRARGPRRASAGWRRRSARLSAMTPCRSSAAPTASVPPRGTTICAGAASGPGAVQVRQPNQAAAPAPSGEQQQRAAQDAGRSDGPCG